MPDFMRSMTREQRRNWWARQLSRQQSTNTPVIAFCRQLGVPVSSFYEWKKRLAQAPPPSLQPAPLERSLPRPFRPGAGSAEPASFVPVAILPPATDVQLEIELVNSCVVRLKGALDPAMLQAAIVAAGGLRGPGEGGR
jgi:hypothetical protein